MPSKISDLQTELKTLQKQLDGLNLQALQKEADRTRAAFEAHVVPPMQQADAVHDALRRAFQDANNELNNAKSQHRDLASTMQPLAAMLGAPGALAAASADLKMAEKRLLGARASLMKTQQTHNRVLGLLANAEAEHHAAVDQAGSLMLAAARDGTSVKSPAPDRGQVDSLAHALTLAAAEVAGASETHEAAQHAMANAQAEVDEAQLSASRLSYELAMRDFAAVAAAHRRVDQHFSFDSLEQRVRQLEHGEVE